MNLQQLEHLLALIDAGTFSRAAEQVHLTQPALSRSIQALEGELGTPLIERLRRRCTPTPAGERVATHARRALLALSEMRRSAEQVAHLTAGRLHLGLGATPHEILAGPILSHALSQAPGVTLRLRGGAPDELFRALRERSLDALIIHKLLLPAWDDLSVELLPPLRLGFLCRNGHPLQTVPRLRFTHLRPYPLLASGNGLSAEMVQRLNQRFGHEAHFGDLIQIKADAVGCLQELARTTDAIFFGVVETGRRHLEAGTLVELCPGPALALSSQFALVTLRGAASPPLWRLVYEVILATMQDR